MLISEKQVLALIRYCQIMVMTDVLDKGGKDLLDNLLNGINNQQPNELIEIGDLKNADK